MSHIIFEKISTHPKLLLIGLAIAILCVFGVQSVRAEDRRIVTVFFEGQEMVVPTTASTVGEVLERMDIELFEKDLVEPGLDEEIVADTFNINIYRARPVTIIDGDKRYVVLSPYQSPRRVAESAGLTVYDEDEFTQERITDFVAQGALGVKQHIHRSVPVVLHLYGEELAMRTQARTVAELLEEKGVVIGDNETVRPALDAPLADAASGVYVLRVGSDVVVEDQPIEFDEQIIQDTSKEISYREIQTPGEDGEKTVTYEVTYENDVEISRSVLQEVVTKEPKQQVVVVGTQVPPPTAGSIGGTKQDWMRAAGIPEDQWVYVDFIVSRESGWNPLARNPSSGACGLAQALPCSKVGAGATDPVVALQWQHGYVNARYGGYAGAYEFWQANHWY